MEWVELSLLAHLCGVYFWHFTNVFSYVTFSLLYWGFLVLIDRIGIMLSFHCFADCSRKQWSNLKGPGILQATGLKLRYILIWLLVFIFVNKIFVYLKNHLYFGKWDYFFAVHWLFLCWFVLWDFWFITSETREYLNVN